MSYFAQIKQLLLPYTCVLCAELSDQRRDLCKACEEELPWLEGACKRCGLRLPAGAGSDVCGGCLTTAPPFDRTFALYEYHNPIDHMISAAKFNNHLVYTRLFGELMASQIKMQWYVDGLPELIIPVPLHTKRLRERGYNQSLEIAKTVAKKLALPIDTRHCLRIKATDPQSRLVHAARAANVKQAFTLRKPLTVKHVAILDDVVTTGNTVSELTQVLKAGGVERVDVWCCARTQLETV